MRRQPQQLLSQRGFAAVALPAIGIGIASCPEKLMPTLSVCVGPSVTQRRWFAPGGGPITPFKGFATSDVIVKESGKGGPARRGVFSNHRIGFDREILRADAFSFYISDDPEPIQSKELLRDILRRYAKGDEKEVNYVDKAVRMMMTGGTPIFDTEEECHRFIMSIDGGAELLREGKLNTYDVQKLAMQVEFNRFPIEYAGRKGLACIPEVSLFNHSCDPNIEVTIKQHEVSKWFYASVRSTKPINEGEELLINYFPNNDLPLSRLQIQMRERWGFECACAVCRSRMMSCLAVIMVFVVFPLVYPMHRMYLGRLREKQRSL